MQSDKMHGYLTWAFLWGIKVTYRGIVLRSKLEHQFVLACEKKKGIELGVSLLYEPKNLRVKYVNPLTGKRATYWPDFYDIEHNVLYEVKHVGRANDAIQAAKEAAFRSEHPDIEYVLVTEKDIKAWETD